jgi:uncharacterized membrane protein
MKLKKSEIIYMAGIILALAAARPLLGTDFPAFLRWYLMLLLMGAGFYPLTSVLFGNFSDHGWVFSKTIGIAIGGYLVWVFSVTRLVQFTNRRAIVITMIAAGVCWTFFMLRKTKASPDFSRMLGEELIFLVFFLMWTYLCGFRPAASGTEKFMDYGFMAAMNRSIYLPATDIWYGQAPINYYYGGQFYGVYMAKLCYMPIRYAYHLLRATVAACAFIFPFEIVSWMLRDQLRKNRHVHAWSAAGGFIAGAAVSLAGNFHYVLYGLLGEVFRLQGSENYWFPDSTRFIGYNPETQDKCIHEFPCYSFILGDDHAHMLNIMFVLTAVAILYAWTRQSRTAELEYEMRRKYWEEKQKLHPDKYVRVTAAKKTAIFIRNNMLEPHLIFAAFLIGLFQWTNYWDYVIYYTVAAFVMLFDCFFRYQKHIVKGLGSLLIHLIEVFIFSRLAALPFTLTFDSSMAGGIAAAENHTPLWQFMILWGFPLLCLVVYVIFIITAYEKKYRSGKITGSSRFLAFFRHVSLGDRFALILGICGFGLIVIPELVFVRDIYYTSGYARSNTMFKLTYQAFILFGMMMAYIFIRFISYHDDSFAEGKLLGRINRRRRMEISSEDSDVPDIGWQYSQMMRGLQENDENSALKETSAVISPAGGMTETPRDAVSSAARTQKAKQDRRDKETGEKARKDKERKDREQKKKRPQKQREPIEISGIQAAGVLLAACFALTLGYFPYSVMQWFGNVTDRSGYKGLDATSFLDEQYPEDADAIRWLNDHVKGQKIVLEAYGDSYSEYCRVSAMTGLPTIEGWYVHEWLWRMNPADLDAKKTDIDTIYMNGSAADAESLLKAYNVSYIFVGSCERALYPDLSVERLKNLGSIVYDNGSTFIIRTDVPDTDPEKTAEHDKEIEAQSYTES